MPTRHGWAARAPLVIAGRGSILVRASCVRARRAGVPRRVFLDLLSALDRMTPLQASSQAARVVAAPNTADGPPTVQGKFFWTGGEKFYLRAVSYGPFASASHGDQFPERDVV